MIASILNLILGIIVLSRNYRRLNNLLFGLLSITATIWIFNNFMMGVTNDKVFWLKGAYAWGGLVISSGLVWVWYLCNSKYLKWKSSIIYILSGFFFFSSYINGLIVGDVTNVYLGRFEGTTGPLFVLYSIFFFGVALTIIFRLFTGFVNSRGIKKSQLLFVLLGSSLYIFISVLVSFILPLFGYLKLMALDSPSSFIFIGSIAYAITRYRLLDIRIIILRSLSFGAIVVLITVIFAIFSATLGMRLEQIIGFRSDIIVGLIVGLIVTLTYQPTKRFIEKITNRFLYKKSYDPDELISKVSEVASSILNLNQLLTEVSRNLIDAFQCEKFGVALINKDKKSLDIVLQEGVEAGVAERLAGYKGVVEILQKEVRNLGGILVIDEMKTRYENGEFKPVSVELLMALHQNDIALIVPLFTKEKLTGVLAIGTKKSGDPYNQQDLNVLGIISGQIAIAIENARLYEEQKQFAVTLQQKVEEATKNLRQANAQLKEMDQMKSDFISIASHQLRTPLTVIKGYISMMNEGSFGKVPSNIKKQLEKVYISNERLIGLVENLLDISRIESGRQEFNWEQIDFEELAQTVVGNLKATAKTKGLKLIYHKPAKPLPKILADKKIYEVMINFVDNAIKYTKQGSIEVFVKPEPENIVTFEVKDTGVGLTKEAMVHLFKKFSRAKGSFQLHTEGMGLGLFVAKMLIDAHKGVIGAESEGRDKGSRLFFSIPIDGPKSKHQPQEPVTRYLGKE